MLLAGIAVAILVVVGVVAAIATQSNTGPETGTDTGRGRETTPGTATMPRTDTTPGTDVATDASRYRQLAENTFLTIDYVDPAIIDCLAQGFEAEPDLVDTIAAMPEGEFAFYSSADADTYAGILVNCATAEVLQELATDIASSTGTYNQSSLVCISTGVANYDASTWIWFVSSLVSAENAYMIEDEFNLCL